MANSTRQPCLMLAWLFLGMAAPALAQTTPTNPNYTLGPDPNLAGCPPAPTGPCHGSKLSANDSLVIDAPIAVPMTGNPANPNAPVCYSITNKTANNYFVPWNSAIEWTDFLNAIGAPYQLTNAPYTGPWPAPGGWVSAQISTSCCAPQAIGHICPDGSGPYSNTQLGYRWEGTKSVDQGNWGANADVYGPVYASVLNGDPNQTYRVTFVCSNGAWVQTHSEGSCSPVAGQCGAGTQGITALPPSCANSSASDYCSELCAPSSIFGGFTNAGGAAASSGWTWTCLGTPGQPPATCSASTAVNGQCGSANGQGQNWGIYGNYVEPANLLCANGTTPSAITGPDANGWNSTAGEQDVPNLYHWTCAGIGGSTATVSCSAPVAYGTCASSTGISSPTAPPANFYFCSTGTPSAVTYGTNNIWGSWAWAWTCSGAWGVWNTCYEMDSSAPQPGACGSNGNGSVVTSDTVPPSGNLCGNSPGTNLPSTLVSGPTFVLGTPSSWVWSCQGANNGSTAGCSATYDPFPAVCGPASVNSISVWQVPATGDLCSVGTPQGLNLFNDYWNWSCVSALGTTTNCSAPTYMDGQCGTANGVPSTVTPTALCVMDPSGMGPFESAVTNVSGTWEWQCLGNGGGATENCSAPVGTPSAATCGTASGTSTPSAPYLGLCGNGTPTSVVDNGTGQWIWQCTSTSGTANCSATNSATGPGVCGAANGTAIPDQPNVNLCASGAVGPVTGTGPWNWSCIGEGASVGQNASCSANICQACTGTITEGNNTPITTGNVSPSNCTAQGQAMWLETDAISPSNASVSLQWNDPFYGTFLKTFNAVTAPSGYCPPCYRNLQSVSNAQVAVQAAAGSCPANTPLNSGNPVTYTPTNVTVTP